MGCSTCNNITIPNSNIPGANGTPGADGAAGASVSSASVSSAGVLTLTMSDGSTVVATGNLTGPTGAAGSPKILRRKASTLFNNETFTVAQSALTSAGFSMSTVHDFNYEVWQVAEIASKGAPSIAVEPNIDARVADKITSMTVDATSGDITFTFKIAGSYVIIFLGV